jgi:plastocyanin
LISKEVVMTDSLDSRALRLTDCYAQRFMKAGTYPYHVLPVPGRCVAERPFTVRVGERITKEPMKQHRVAVRSEAGRFRAEPSEVVIEAGDLVLWNCTDAQALPYIIVGEKPFFASNRLTNESGYSHAFAAAGEYRWRDAYGSGAAGTIRVRMPDCGEHSGYERWQKSLATGTLVTVTEARAEPAEIEIALGQTVFFAITKGPGISITDERLLDLDGGPLRPQGAERSGR